MKTFVAALLGSAMLLFVSGCLQHDVKDVSGDDVIKTASSKEAPMLERKIDKVKELASRFPDEPKYPEQLARLYWRDRDHDNALKYLAKARKLDPENPKYDYLEAGIYYSLGSFRNAERCYKDLKAKLGDSFAGPDYELGWLYLEEGQLDLAEEHFQNCVRINDKLASVYYGLAQVALKRRDRDSAIANFEQYLKLGGGSKTEDAVKELKALQPELRSVIR